jgi:hypothetical protein
MNYQTLHLQLVLKTVTIPACVEHDGILSRQVVLKWECPICGQPRGEVQDGRSYDGSRILYCHTWVNPCGHVDKYSDVRKEANENLYNGGQQ